MTLLSWGFLNHETLVMRHSAVCLNCLTMCPMGVSPLRVLMKGSCCQALGFIVLYQTAWMGWLIPGCIAAPPSGSVLNSVIATTPQIAGASYAHPEQHHLRVMRHRSFPPISIYKSPASLKGGHGECCLAFLLQLLIREV